MIHLSIRKFIAVCALIIILVILCLFLFLCNTTKVLNELPEYYTENQDLSLDSDIVETSDDAVSITKTAIKIVYNEAPSGYKSYSVYFDEVKELYYVVASGKLFHGSVYVVVDKKDGSIVHISHGKF